MSGAHTIGSGFGTPPELLISCEARQVLAPGFEQKVRRPGDSFLKKYPF